MKEMSSLTAYMLFERGKDIRMRKTDVEVDLVRGHHTIHVVELCECLVDIVQDGAYAIVRLQERVYVRLRRVSDGPGSTNRARTLSNAASSSSSRA